MRFSRRAIVVATAACVAFAALAISRSAQAARRIVSLNVCTDELLLRLADPARIASVTWLARNPSGSNVADLAARVPVNYGLAEEVVAAEPDLVLAGTFTTRIAVAMLKRTALPVLEFRVPRTFDEVREQIRTVASLVDADAKGKDLNEDIDRRIAAVSAKVRAARPTAAVLNPNGSTVGDGTLADAVMKAAGFDNVAASLRIDRYGQLPLEIVASGGLDVLIVSASRDGPPSMATDILRHPVLAKLDRTRIVVLPGRLWNCAGPGVAEAVERLGIVADEVARTRATQ